VILCLEILSEFFVQIFSLYTLLN